MTSDAHEIQEPTRQAVFGALGTASTASAITQRLRTAIGLGLLADGERLPREYDLAEQFGVTAFSLREALSALREQGLIETKRGRTGGSFVRRPANLFQSVATEQLLQLSGAALRDVSDWGWTLLSATAHHGALRASRGNIQRLHEYSRGIGDAPDGATATGVSGRFHVELAAATQSVRISAAQIAYQAEFGWLHALLLEDDAERARLAADAVAITRAVEARDPGAARQVAEASSEASMHRILELRLEHIAPYVEDQQ